MRSPITGMRAHHAAARRRRAGPGLCRIASGIPILPTSCSSATADSSASASRSRPRRVPTSIDERLDGVGVVAGVAVARLERRGERAHDRARRVGGLRAVALEIAQDVEQRVVAGRQPVVGTDARVRSRRRPAARAGRRMGLERGSAPPRPSAGRSARSTVRPGAWTPAGRQRCQAIGRLMPAGSAPSRPAPGPVPAPATASWSTGSSAGNIASRPRAA